MISTAMLSVALATLDLAQSACASAPRLPQPPAGLTVEFEFQSGGVASGMGSETIEAASPPGATFNQALVLPDGSRKVTGSRSSIYRVFPLDGPSIGGSKMRSQSYDADPASLLTGLAPGKSVTIPFRETFAVNGKTHTRAAKAKVTFLGCSTLDVAGSPEPVLVYRVSMSTLVVGANDKRVAPRHSETTFSVSQTYGWRIREEGTDGVLQATSISLK
jgi:hypothetical protein